jgi:hypothetical protein
MDVIYVDTPSNEAAEQSSSYNLSIFSSGNNPKGVIAAAAMREGCSPSIGELWPNIDKLDSPSCEGTSAARNVSAPERRLIAPIEDVGGRPRDEDGESRLRSLLGHLVLDQEGTRVVPHEKRLHRSCLLPLMLFLCPCEGRL